jgi:acetate kinase
MQKYGFYGMSVRYVFQKATAVLRDMNPTRESFEMVVCHLGNGART